MPPAFTSVHAQFKSAPAAAFPSAPPELVGLHTLPASETWMAHLILRSSC